MEKYRKIDLFTLDLVKFSVKMADKYDTIMEEYNVGQNKRKKMSSTSC